MVAFLAHNTPNSEAQWYETCQVFVHKPFWMGQKFMGTNEPSFQVNTLPPQQTPEVLKATASLERHPTDTVQWAAPALLHLFRENVA